ncbi:MAG TPA: type I 3-dehydroquinate dehydratase [Syntrophales bacterium]|nr:type I 3-dehydroquinate dehydratase [Syntrophales bacterium]
MICVSICAGTQKQALHDIAQAVGLCDMLELRMDEITDGHLGELMAYIAKLAPEKLVLVTHRKTKAKIRRVRNSKDQFGHEDVKAMARWEVLQDAVRRGAAYVDVELEDGDDEISALKDLILQNGCRTKLVCSHHDFQKTPSLKGLKSLYQACVKKGADVVKIVPYARSAEDNIRAFQLLAWATEQEKDIVAFCMGEKGRLSRIAAPLFGAAFTFAALDENSAVAPGQIAAKDMVKILGILARTGA